MTASPLVECVANVSEGRRPEVVNAIAAAATQRSDVALLDIESDADHNRSVITLAASPEAVGEAAVELVGAAIEQIDLNHHTGVHPRIGAADVIPFVPLRNITLVECGWIAHAVGAEIWNRFQLPVYLYADAALIPERRSLPAIRKGNFEGLREAVKTDMSRFPDFGQNELHPTAGAVAVGARRILIAWNIGLESDDLAVAQTIATSIRESSGGLPSVRALGLPLLSKGIVQVSMNLLHYELTPPHIVMRAVEQKASELGVRLGFSELVGLIPQAALDWADEAGVDLRLPDGQRTNTIEARLAAAGL